MKRFILLSLLFSCMMIAVVNAQEKRKSFNIEKPSIRAFLPDSNLATGRAIVVCPGGGYEHLALEHEGYDWAPYFNKQGIALFVLKYRMPHGDPSIPVSDVEAAIRLVRDSASVWNINPDDIGIMGFSAGGHLASTVATHCAESSPLSFQILFYPVITMDRTFTHMGSHDNFVGKEATEEFEKKYSNEKSVTKRTPRAFIVFSNDDTVVSPENGIRYYSALHANGIPAVIHIYATGGHGWGIREDFRYKKEMLDELSAWLRDF